MNAEVVPEPASSDKVVLAEYRLKGMENWLIVRGLPGETYEQLEAFMHREFPNLSGVRPRRSE